jgi:magnesium transporter
MKDRLLEKIKSLLEENTSNNTLKNIILDVHPADIVYYINRLDSENQVKLFSLLDESTASDVLNDLHDDVREHIIESLNTKRLTQIIDEMESDDAADIISELDDDDSEKVLESIDSEDSENIRTLLKYDEHSAGGLMQTEIIAVSSEAKRDELIEYIRDNREKVENIHYVYVVDEQNKLRGLMEIPSLLFANENDKAKDLMEDDIFFVKFDEDQEQVANIFRKYDLISLPVVDYENHLLGRITVDDVIDVIDEEASEDAYKMVGLDSDDKVFTAPIESVKKRLPWLVLNLFTAILVSSVVGFFQGAIEKLSVLAVLMPIVAGLGGNAGIQTLTVITRGIAMGEMTLTNTWRAIIKEISVGLINGVMIGSSASLIAYLLKGDIKIGLVLGVAMIINMFIAGLMGSIIPVIMRTLKIDPALASSIIITMLTDICGYASFLGLASIFLLH